MKIQPRTLLLGTSIAGALALAMAGCQKTPETTGSVAPASLAANDAGDAAITAAINSTVKADASLKVENLKIDTVKGVVQLEGNVEDQAQADHVLVVVRGVSGVTNVDNKLKVKGSGMASDGKDDSDISAKVKTALLDDAKVKDLDIAVVANKGDVKLTGTVDNQGQIDAAVKTARSVAGVQNVQDQLTLKK